MSTDLETLYDTDFVAWTQRQAGALRQLQSARWNEPLDLPRLAEEIEDLGRSQRDAVRSQIRRIIEHLLKLDHSAAIEPRAGWMRSIAEARATLDDGITPTLRGDVEQQLPRLFTQAREQARLALLQHHEAVDTLPTHCPYTTAQIVEPGWYGEESHE